MAAGFNAISFEIAMAGAAAGYLQAGLEWAGQGARRQAREGIVDAHSLSDVPAGSYMLKIGMYDAVTQVRFAASAADGAVLPDGILPLGSIAIP